MLRRAVRFAIERNVDVVLFSGSFEGGGDGDGRGPINRIVADALAADILWINAAGNYGSRVYSGPVRILSDGLLRLGYGTDIAALRFRNRVDENSVTITLTWNDYREQEDAGTDKDLDLIVEDWTGRRIGAGEKVQVKGPETTGPDETLNPRERVVLTRLPASPDVPSRPRLRLPHPGPGQARGFHRSRPLASGRGSRPRELHSSSRRWPGSGVCVRRREQRG